MTTPQIFIITGLIFIASELFIGIQTGFDLVAIGSCVLIGGISGQITQNYTISYIVSILLSITYIFFGRTFIKKQVVVLTHKTNIDKLIGKTGIVIRSITPDTAGMIRLDDEDWRATSNDVLYEKDRVSVEAIEGVTLRVKKN